MQMSSKVFSRKSSLSVCYTLKGCTTEAECKIITAGYSCFGKKSAHDNILSKIMEEVV